jgi:hypothetical protein
LQPVDRLALVTDVTGDARFPHVAAGAGHYESYYLKAAHPSEPLAVWIRHTVHKAPGGQPVGSLWFTLFGPDGPVARKETLPPESLGAGPGRHIEIGDSRLEEARTVGTALDASWDIGFESGSEPFPYLPKPFMYRAPIPRTKAIALHPRTAFSGHVEVAGRRVELASWPGMVGHNWGSQHAERWIWLQGAGFAEEPDAWLDGTIGRIKVGPVTLPWIANACLSLDGVRHRLGGPSRARATRVQETPTSATLTIPGDGLDVDVRVTAPREATVAWIYSDPDGAGHHTTHCSISDLEVTVRRGGGADRRLTLAAGGAYELGMREKPEGIEIQPYPDP